MESQALFCHDAAEGVVTDNALDLDCIVSLELVNHWHACASDPWIGADLAFCVLSRATKDHGLLREFIVFLLLHGRSLAELLPEDVDMAKLDDELLKYYNRLYPNIVKKMCNEIEEREYEAK